MYSGDTDRYDSTINQFVLLLELVLPVKGRRIGATHHSLCEKSNFSLVFSVLGYALARTRGRGGEL